MRLLKYFSSKPSVKVVSSVEADLLERIRRIAVEGWDEADRRHGSDLGHVQECIAIGEMNAFNRILCEFGRHAGR